MIVRKKYVKVVKFQLQVATLRCYFIHKSTVHFHKFMIQLSHSNFFSIIQYKKCAYWKNYIKRNIFAYWTRFNFGFDVVEKVFCVLKRASGSNIDLTSDLWNLEKKFLSRLT